MELYQASEGDNTYSISQAVYGDQGYASYIMQENPDIYDENELLADGAILQLPGIWNADGVTINPATIAQDITGATQILVYAPTSGSAAPVAASSTPTVSSGATGVSSSVTSILNSIFGVNTASAAPVITAPSLSTGLVNPQTGLPVLATASPGMSSGAKIALGVAGVTAVALIVMIIAKK